MKAKYCVIVADARRARIFELKRPDFAEIGQSAKLVELADLVHPERRLRGSEMFTDSRPGMHRGSGGKAPSHGVDDGRDAHRDEIDRRFASKIVGEGVRVSSELGATRIVLAATHGMLGLLRSDAAKLAASGAKVLELPQELTGLTPARLYTHLASEKVLP
jgi:hypothetical protein